MSDLAVEFGASQHITEPVTEFYGGIAASKLDISRECDAEIYGRKCGIYYTVACDSDKADAVSNAVGEVLYSLIGGSARRIMIVGFGNPKYIADAFGTRVLDCVKPCANLIKLYPLVSGVTGIESSDFVVAMAERVRPDVVIAIDTLATLSADRLGSVVQITNAGLNPASGLGKGRGMIDAKRIGVPLVALGVPLVVKFDNLLYTSAEIDVVMDSVASIVGAAIVRMRDLILSTS